MFTKVKPTSSVFRHFNKYKYLGFSVYLKFFFKIKNKNGYSWGKKMIYSKKSCSKKLFNSLNFFNFTLYFLVGFQLSPKKHFSIFKNSFNKFFILQRIQFTLPGQIIYVSYLKELFLLSIIRSNCSWDKTQKIFFSYLNLPLIYFSEGWVISNLGFDKLKYSRSSSTKCRILSFSIKHNFFTISLPSEKIFYFPSFWKAYLGVNSGFGSKTVLGKYKHNNNKNKKFSVRGVAKNPVDHPHGGRTKTNVPEVSPWNWVAKHSH